MTAGDGAAAASSSRAADLLLKTQAIELLQARRSERQFCSGGTSLLHVHCTGSGTQEPSIASSACADSALLIMSRVVRNIRFVVPLPAPKHLCSKRRDQKCKTLWGGYADDPGTDGARHWAKWRGDRAEATGQRARPKADGQSCTLATPRGSSIRVPIGRLSPEAFSRGVFASGRETRSGRFFLGPQWCPTELQVHFHLKFTDKVFISTPEDTGPAYTQMKLQHRSRAPGPPYNSRTRSAAGPGRETLSPARSP